jgi:hypothetical protein
MKTQICLLSGELMPNVIGVLQARASRVIPVVSRESESQVEGFTMALRAAGSAAEVLPPVTVLPYDLADCLSTLRKAAGSEPSTEFNWTGGTKIMSYAARRLAEDLRLPALYVNTAAREVLLEDLAQNHTRIEMIDTAQLGLNVLVHLLAAGHDVEGAESLEAFRVRCTPAPALVKASTLIMDARPWERTEVLKLAGAVNRPYRPKGMNDGFLSSLTEARLIQPGVQAGEYFLSPDTLLHPFHRQSPQEQNAAFLKNTYLEVFLWSQIKERSAVDDAAWHVVLNPGVKGRVAELDVTLATEGRFLVLECKSHLDLEELADVIEEQYARTRRIGRLFGRWILYVHRHRTDYPAANAAAIIASQEAKAFDYGGKLLWHDDLADLPITVSAFLNESKAAL